MANNNRTIGVADLSDALQELLTVYHQGLVEKLDEAGEAAIKKMVKLTKASAPVLSGSFKRNIAYKKITEDWLEPSKFVWHVKAPDYRITHLVVHGHDTGNGGRARGNSFLASAKESVLPEYERAVEEAIRNG